MTDATESPQTETPEPAGLDAILEKSLEGYGEESPPSTETPEETSAEERTRNSDGTFAKKSAEDEPSTEPVQTEAEAASDTEAEPPAQEPVEPPARWSDADKSEFAKLTPDAQRLLLARYNAIEGDYTRKTQDLAEQRKTVEPLIGELGKWNPYLQQLGVSPEQAFSQMMTVERNLRTGTPEQKANALAYLAQLYGAPIPSQDGQWQQPDPASTQLHQTVAGLQAQLQQLKEQENLREQEWAQAEFNAIGQTKDENGQPKYPHFERVSRTMLQLVANGQSDNWDDAYQRSIWGDPELREQQLQAERQRVAAEAEKQRLAAVEKAKKAKPVQSSEGAPKGGTQLKGLDAHLGAALAKSGF